MEWFLEIRLAIFISNWWKKEKMYFLLTGIYFKIPTFITVSQDALIIWKWTHIINSITDYCLFWILGFLKILILWNYIIFLKSHFWDIMNQTKIEKWVTSGIKLIWREKWNFGVILNIKKKKIVKFINKKSLQKEGDYVFIDI